MTAVRIIRGVLALPFRGLGWCFVALGSAGFGVAAGLGWLAALIAGR